MSNTQSTSIQCHCKQGNFSMYTNKDYIAYDCRWCDTRIEVDSASNEIIGYSLYDLRSASSPYYYFGSYKANIYHDNKTLLVAEEYDASDNIEVWVPISKYFPPNQEDIDKALLRAIKLYSFS